MKVKELMVKNVITLQTDTSVHEAVKLLNKNKIGCLVVVRDGDIEGILTERDLLERVLEGCRNPKETRISEIMTKDVIVGKPDMEIYEATRIMIKNKVKKLPIVEKSQLVGIVTVTDIARATDVDKKTIELVDALSNMHMLPR
ncbi:MAG TPA: CBS domain-containing protein [Candidatus Krumholzibacteriaceae bacterium]|jgi:CBS domain-containing protein|nr:CBS domain-containing protein [Candidatus Krumholzibacteriaceae bacterium]